MKIGNFIVGKIGDFSCWVTVKVKFCHVSCRYKRAWTPKSPKKGWFFGIQWECVPSMSGVIPGRVSWSIFESQKV